MKRTKLYLVSLLAALPILGILGLTATAQARNARADDNLHISQGQVIGSTLFAAGRQITMDGQVEGDMFCAGQNVTIGGHVEGDIICAAQNIRITGQVDGDIRLAAQNATISGQVAGNATAAGDVITVEGDGKVGRDLSVASSSLITNGQIGRDVKAAGETVIIDGKVGRNADLYVSDFRLGRSAEVAGNVTYESERQLNRDPGAQVSGRLDRHEPEHRGQDSGWGATIGMALYIVLAMLITSLLLVLLVPRLFRRVSDAGLRSPGKTVLIGFLTSLVAPLVIITLMLTVIGIPLGLLALLVWLAVLFISAPVAAYMAGRLLLKENRNPLLIMLAGAAVVAVLYLIPIVNFFAVLAVVWFGVGSLVLYLWELYKTPETPAPDNMPAAAAPEPKLKKPANI